MDDIISILTVKETGSEHNNVFCPHCKNVSKPYGLCEKSKDKIQLVRKCRVCSELFWYWIDVSCALIPFSED